MKAKIIIKQLFVVCFLGHFLGIATNAEAQNKEEKSRKDYFESMRVTGTIISGIQRFFVDTVDIAKIHTVGMNAMLQRLDPYTEYMDPERAKAFRESTSGIYAGIGAIINQRPDKKVVINEPMQGQPADLAGLFAGDWIQEIDGKDFRYSSSAEVSKALKGEEGTKIDLQILRRGEKIPRKISFIRKKIAMNSVSYSSLLGDGIAYLSLSSFTIDSDKEVKKALLDLQAKGMTKGLIFDLRNNGGGVLQSAITILSYFLPKGTKVLEIKGRDKSSNAVYKTENEPLFLDLPLVVMINDSSASASEIVSGALQDNDRAVIVGEKSYGKGLVQSTLSTQNGGLFKLTTARYYIPSGRLIQKIQYDHQGRAKELKSDSVGTAFKTKKGRLVYAAGGITPDLDLSADTLASIVTYLAVDTLVNDYAVDYVLAAKKKLPKPDQFFLTEKEYQHFIHYLAEKNFSYKTVSEFYLDRFEKVYKTEQLDRNAAKELEALRKALKSDIKRDGLIFKEDIKQFLEGLIVRILYYRKGFFDYLLPKDKQVKTAVSLLLDSHRYKSLLEPLKETKK